MTSPLGWDSETFPFGPYLKAPAPVCWSAAWRATPSTFSTLLFKVDGDGLTPGTTAEDAVRAILARPSTGVNLSYDLAVLCAWRPALIKAVFDALTNDRISGVDIRQRLLDIAHGQILRPVEGQPGPYGMYALAKRLLNREIKKDDDTYRKRYPELLPVPRNRWPAEAVDYAITDATTPVELWEVQEQYAPTGVFAPQFREMRADFWLHLKHCWGFDTDQRRLEEFAEEIGSEYRDLETVLIREGIVRNDAKRTRDTGVVKRRIERAAIAAGIEPKETKGGDISTDADICKALAPYDSPKIEVVIKGERKITTPLGVYARIGSLKSMLSKDVKAFRGQPRIHPNYEGLNMNGRTSSFKPQVQNLPRVVGPREVIVPRPGYLYAINDYPQIELRTWAQICLWVLGRSRMAELLNACDSAGVYNPLDPHADLGARILKCSYEECKARIKAEEKYARGTPTPATDARQISKVGNFGYMGGMGWQTFIGYAREQFDIVLEPKDAKDLHVNWKENWPEAEAYFAWIKRAHNWTQAVSAKGYPMRVTTIRHFVSGMIRGRAVYTDACNNYFSALAQVIGKEAVFQIARECYDESCGSVLFGCRPVNWVHDEEIVEVPEDALAHERAMRIGEIMDSTAQRILPDVRTKSEPCLSRRYSKKAKAIYDARGRLVPWEEKRRAA